MLCTKVSYEWITTDGSKRSHTSQRQNEHQGILDPWRHRKPPQDENGHERIARIRDHCDSRDSVRDLDQTWDYTGSCEDVPPRGNRSARCNLPDDTADACGNGQE